MGVVLNNEDISKVLVPYREPADMSTLVSKASNSLNELECSVNSFIDDESLKINIEPALVKEIISSLVQLNDERLWLHDAVEAETIKSSVLRHKLGDFPRDIEKEVSDAVRSARHSNDETIKAYSEQLHVTEENIQLLKHKLELLSVSNVTLGPEQEEMRSQHDEIINVLNQTLMKKASMQIKLNDTRERLRDTYNRIKDFEQAFIELNEDMKLEDQEACAEEERLQKQINETSKKIAEQQDINIEKKIEVEELKVEQSSKREEVELKKETASKREIKCSQLKELSDRQTQQLEEDVADNTMLVQLGESLTKDQDTIQEDYANEKERLEQEILSLVTAKQAAQIEYNQLQSQCIRTMNLLDEAESVCRKNKDEVEDMQKSLRSIKDNMLHQSSECVRLKKENAELEMQIERTKQEHAASCGTLKKDIEIYQTTLETERKERQLLQTERDAVGRESSNYLNEFNKFVAKTIRMIGDGKARHQQQSRRGLELQTKFKEVEKTLKKKQRELTHAKDGYMTMQKELKAKVKTVEDNIRHLENEIKTRQQQLEDEQPGFTELKELYARKTEEFDSMKKLIVELKTKKAYLSSEVQRKQTNLEDMEVPKLKMQNDLQLAREEYLKQLQRETGDMKEIENNIYNTDQEYIAVRRQNERFQSAVKFFQDDIAFMTARMETMYDGKHDIDIAIGEYKDWLELQWRKHKELDEKYHKQDVLLLDDIKKVQQVTSQRERRVGDIHERLEEQLNILTEFISKAADMRQKIE